MVSAFSHAIPACLDRGKEKRCSAGGFSRAARLLLTCCFFAPTSPSFSRFSYPCHGEEKENFFYQGEKNVMAGS
jgi:hypothetical protein